MDNKNGLYIVAIVGLVALVALLILIIDRHTTTQTGTETTDASGMARAAATGGVSNCAETCIAIHQERGVPASSWYCNDCCGRNNNNAWSCLN